MQLNEINNLCEVITEFEFHNLMNQLILQHKNITDEEVIKCLDILGEKFEKFYNINEINNQESNFIYKTLLRLSVN